MESRVFGRPLFSGFGLPGFAFKESNFLPEPMPRSLFEALRSKRFVRNFAFGLVLVMGSTFAALQAVSVDTGATSTIDNYLEVNVSGDLGQAARHPDINFTNGQTNGTWEGWIYPTRGTGLQMFFSKEDNYHFGILNGQLVAYFNSSTDGWKTNLSIITVPLNAWSHVAFVKDSTTVLVYLNGQIAGAWFGGAHSTLSAFNNLEDFHRFHIGRRVNGDFFSGRIDEVRVWNGVRTSTEIANNMHVRVPGNTPGLQGYWDFNEPNGPSVYDRTIGYNQTLTLLGSPARADVKTISSNSSGSTVVTFPRTYLPGVSTWSVPNNVSRVKVLAVGAGGGGGSDAGAGGGGGEMRSSSNQAVTPGGSITVQVGAPGRAGSWVRGVNPAGTGGPTVVSGAGLDYQANGGQGGGGFGSPGAIGGSGGRGGTGQNGGQGGNGPNACSPSFGGVGANGPSSDIGASSSRAFGGGGGGGHGSGQANVGDPQWGSAGGSGGGGRGANYKLNHDGSGRNGASAGQEGAANTGGGGGGGSACDAGSVNGVDQRTDGGNGGTGVVIIEYTPTKDLAWQGASSLQRSSTTIPPRFYTNSTPLPTLNNQAFTAEAWVYHDERSGEQTIFGGGTALNDVTHRFYLAVNASGNFTLRWPIGGTGFGV
jgi:hypothetical protein